jgi:dihydrofolate reductase
VVPPPVVAAFVVAASDNDVIGAGGDLPWHIPEDMRRFRRVTMGHVVVLGRVTHESIVARLGRSLPGRTSIVISHAALGHPPPPGSPSPGLPPPRVPPPAGAAPSAPTPPAPGHPESGRPESGRPLPPAAPPVPPAPGGPVLVAGSVTDGLRLAGELAAAAGDREFFIAGGESVYRQALEATGWIYLTRVHQDVAGDRSMPAGWLDGFRLVSREEGISATGIRYEFLDYERLRA